MNETIKKLLLMSGGKMKYGTAGTTTTTSLASQGGLLINIDSATGDIPQTASGWIEDEKYGFYAREFATSTSAEFDTAVTRTGSKTLKLSTLDATGVCRVLNIAAPDFSTAATNLASSGKLIPIKGSTKYRYSVFAKTNNAAASSVLVQFQQLTNTGATTSAASSSLLSGTVDWTNLTGEFTTNASAVWIGFVFYISTAGNISDAWFDINSMTLEEVIEPVANSLVTPSPSLVSFTAVGSTDNIDQSQLTISASINLGTASQYCAQQFTPTKSKLTGIVLRKATSIGAPTGDMVFRIATDSADAPTSTILASYTMPSATYNALSVATNFTINLPCNLTAGTKYWILVNYSISSGTDHPHLVIGAPASVYSSGLFKYGSNGITYGTTFDGDFYFQTLYYKPTTNFKASQNNTSISISADEEGFVEGSVINISTGTWSFTDPINDGFPANNMYFSRTSGVTFSSNTIQFSGINQNYVLKINLGLVATSDMTYTIGFITNNTFTYSYDNVSYNALGTLVGAGGSYTIPMVGYSTVYIKNNANAAGSMTNHSASCSVDTSSLSTLRNYPTNKDIIKQYSTTLGSATTSATYRATKWGFPAIEYSATEYQFLDVDTTGASAVVSFSELGSSYTTVADGASLAITSTSTPNLFVKVLITVNRIYISSNDYVASSDKDGSLKQSVIYKVMQ